MGERYTERNGSRKASEKLRSRQPRTRLISRHQYVSKISLGTRLRSRKSASLFLSLLPWYAQNCYLACLPSLCFFFFLVALRNWDNCKKRYCRTVLFKWKTFKIIKHTSILGQLTSTKSKISNSVVVLSSNLQGLSIRAFSQYFTWPCRLSNDDGRLKEGILKLNCKEWRPLGKIAVVHFLPSAWSWSKRKKNHL